MELIFLIKSFFYMTEKSRQKFKYLENKKSFQVRIKTIFHVFESAFSSQNLSHTWECTFNKLTIVWILSLNSWCICYAFMYISHNCYSLLFNHFGHVSLYCGIKLRLRYATLEMQAQFLCLGLSNLLPPFRVLYSYFCQTSPC